jgi:divinyl chlorophyllide a 8-vinyl-reductase
VRVQVKLVQQGKPYVMFGDGNLAACKPISEADLARFMADCISGERARGGGQPGGLVTGGLLGSDDAEDTCMSDSLFCGS